MGDTANLTMIVTVYAALIGAGWGLLVDPIRPATWWVAVASVVLTGFLIAGLAPDAALAVPMLGIVFSLTSWARDKMWRASLIREPSEPPRTPPPPPPSASATG